MHKSRMRVQEMQSQGLILFAAQRPQATLVVGTVPGVVSNTWFQIFGNCFPHRPLVGKINASEPHRKAGSHLRTSFLFPVPSTHALLTCVRGSAPGGGSCCAAAAAAAAPQRRCRAHAPARLLAVLDDGRASRRHRRARRSGARPCCRPKHAQPVSSTRHPPRAGAQSAYPKPEAHGPRLHKGHTRTGAFAATRTLLSTRPATHLRWSSRPSTADSRWRTCAHRRISTSLPHPGKPQSEVRAREEPLHASQQCGRRGQGGRVRWRRVTATRPWHCAVHSWQRGTHTKAGGMRLQHRGRAEAGAGAHHHQGGARPPVVGRNEHELRARGRFHQV
jgi:hypothetical protein